MVVIHVTDELVDDLCGHFERSGFTAERFGPGALRVGLAEAPDASQERREIELHLQVWRVMHPGTAVVSEFGRR
jgi:hypothetical protein